MSRRVWGVLLAMIALVLIIGVMAWYFLQEPETAPKEMEGTELVNMLPVENWPGESRIYYGTADTEDMLTEEQDEGYRYKLVNDSNYITVYLVPEYELFEYTDIIMDVLPVEIQEEIRHGKYLRNEEELYNFLENYTS